MSYDDEVCIAKKDYLNLDAFIVKFKPIYIKNENSNVNFEKLSESKRLSVFPNIGTIFSSLKGVDKKIQSSLVKNTFFRVEYYDNPKVDKNDPTKDLKYTRNYTRLLPIISYPRFYNGTFEDVRNNIHDISHLEYPKAYLELKNDKYIKIEKFESSYVITTKPNDKSTVPVYTIDTKDRLHYGMQDSITISICLNDAKGDATKFFAPKEDTRFLDFVLKKLSKCSHSLDSIDHLRTTLKNDPTILEKVFLGFDIDSILERLDTIEDVFISNNDLYEKVRETFSDFPQLQAKLEQEKISLRQALDDELQQYEDEEKSKIEQRIDEQFTEKKSVLAAQKAALEEIEEEIRSRTEALQSQEESFKKEVQEYEAKRLTLRKSLKKEADIFQDMLRQVSPAEIPYARAFADRLTSLFSQDDAPCLPSTISPWGSVRTKETEPISVSNIHGWLQYAIDDENVILLDECVRSGRIPLLFGEHRYAWARLYANSVTGGTLCRMQADPTIFSLDDLWRIPNSTVPTPLAMAWEYNKRTSKPVIVQIDIEESPCHLWGEQLLDLVGNSDWPLGLWIVLTAGHFCSTTTMKNMPLFIPLECATSIHKDAPKSKRTLNDISRIHPKHIKNIDELTSAFNKKFF